MCTLHTPHGQSSREMCRHLHYDEEVITVSRISAGFALITFYVLLQHHAQHLVFTFVPHYKVQRAVLSDLKSIGFVAT